MFSTPHNCDAIMSSTHEKQRKIVPVVDFENFVKLSQTAQFDDSSDDSNFESMPDNESYGQMDSDDEYIPYDEIASKRKRMQTLDKQQNRKISTASSTDNCRFDRVERLPTRRPDPTVQNRNALMARENRRRKKEHVKVLEKELEQKSQEIRCLKKNLKEKDRIVRKLEHETLYLRSTIANKTDIMSLLKTIRGNKLPLTSSTLSFVTENNDQKGHRLNGSVSSRSPTTSTASFGSEEKENGRVATENDPFLTSTQNGFSFSDFDLGFSYPTIDEDMALDDWRSLLNDEVTMPMKSNYIPEDSNSDTGSLGIINSEHNYYQQKNSGSKTVERRDGTNPGICLHLAGGRVSLEFCAACHSSSQNAWIEEM